MTDSFGELQRELAELRADVVGLQRSVARSANVAEWAIDVLSSVAPDKAYEAALMLRQRLETELIEAKYNAPAADVDDRPDVAHYVQGRGIVDRRGAIATCPLCDENGLLKVAKNGLVNYMQCSHSDSSEGGSDAVRS